MVKTMNKNIFKVRSFKKSENINEKGNGPYRRFGFLSLFSAPIYLTKLSGFSESQDQRENSICTIAESWGDYLSP